MDEEDAKKAEGWDLDRADLADQLYETDGMEQSGSKAVKGQVAGAEQASAGNACTSPATQFVQSLPRKAPCIAANAMARTKRQHEELGVAVGLPLGR